MPSLEHLRFPAEQTRGRRYPEAPHPYRNDYQRDRDRVIHARAFRRLENKTQVFTDPVSDHFRNRLTHTLEVSQIARTVAAALGLNEDLVEALALAHDIGHPPFGHSGEARLHVEMQRFGDRFDHNLHALHIVEIFENRYAAFPGLNLTFEVREGIVKHSRDYDVSAFPELAPMRGQWLAPLARSIISSGLFVTLYLGIVVALYNGLEPIRNLLGLFGNLIPGWRVSEPSRPEPPAVCTL